MEGAKRSSSSTDKDDKSCRSSGDEKDGRKDSGTMSSVMESVEDLKIKRKNKNKINCLSSLKREKEVKKTNKKKQDK